MLDIVDRAALAVCGFNNRAHRAAALAEPALDQIIDLRTHAQHRGHRYAKCQLHSLLRIGIVGIGQPQPYTLFIQRQRAYMELFEETQGQRQALGQTLGR